MTEQEKESIITTLLEALNKVLDDVSDMKVDARFNEMTLIILNHHKNPNEYYDFLINYCDFKLYDHIQSFGQVFAFYYKSKQQTHKSIINFMKCCLIKLWYSSHKYIKKEDNTSDMWFHMNNLFINGYNHMINNGMYYDRHLIKYAFDLINKDDLTYICSEIEKNNPIASKMMFDKCNEYLKIHKKSQDKFNNKMGLKIIDVDLD